MIEFSEGQKKALSLWEQGKNIFITGPGGCGKTRFIQHIYETKNDKNIQVSAMTGCAAVLLQCNATTIHSWSGIGFASMDVSSILKKIKKQSYMVRRWKQVECLIIDEISMMPSSILELLDTVAKNVRKSDAPFGGIQIIFAGDFFQLPPIESNSFCFQSPIWNTLFSSECHVQFKTIFRQKETNFFQLLNNLRIGILSQSDKLELKKCINRKQLESIQPTKIFPRRYKVDSTNDQLYKQLDSAEFTFKIKKRHNETRYIFSNLPISNEKKNQARSLSKKQIEFEYSKLIQQYQIPEEVKLKVGAVVMCSCNLSVEEGICNGSQGVITEISAIGPKISFYNGVTQTVPIRYYQSESFPTIVVGQYPLCLAWAVTIHKIQGATLDCAEIDVGKDVFTHGQSYVALSRVKSLNGLYLKNLQIENIKAHPLVSNFYKNLHEN